MTEYAPYSGKCAPHCISGDRLQAALEILGLWFNGEVLDVRLGHRGAVVEGRNLTGHESAWYAEATVAVPSCGNENYAGALEVRKIYVAVHPGAPKREGIDD